MGQVKRSQRSHAHGRQAQHRPSAGDIDSTLTSRAAPWPEHRNSLLLLALNEHRQDVVLVGLQQGMGGGADDHQLHDQFREQMVGLLHSCRAGMARLASALRAGPAPEQDIARQRGEQDGERSEGGAALDEDPAPTPAATAAAAGVTDPQLEPEPESKSKQEPRPEPSSDKPGDVHSVLAVSSTDKYRPVHVLSPCLHTR